MVKFIVIQLIIPHFDIMDGDIVIWCMSYMLTNTSLQLLKILKNQFCKISIQSEIL